MIRNKLRIVILLLMICSNYAFASLEDNKECFPKHIEIDGPPGTAILKLQFMLDIKGRSVIQTSETSFDIIDQRDCKAATWGYNVLYLNVGIDSQHHASRIIEYYNGSDKLAFMRRIDEKFTLSKIDHLSSKDYKLTYENVS